ncbi:MAG: GTPase Era, partial [Bacteroidales bacterium]|nr:GTPase Era [Bacteroidales bacterium]
MTHKAGFVNIIGNPNVGKSTLMNALVGEKLSIITSKAQTTRHRIMGIVNGPNYQIVYSDTPGIIRPHYLLQKNMMQFVDAALVDADIILYVTDVVEKMQKNPSYIEKLSMIEVPVLVALNKIDKSSEDEVRELMSQWQALLPQAGIYPISALEGFNLDSLLQHVLDHLPPAPPWFEKDRK